MKLYHFHKPLLPISTLSLVILLLHGLLTPASSVAQSASGVEGVLISKRIPVGEQTALVLRVINGKPETLPDSIPVEGLEITRSERIEQKHSFGTGGNQSEYQFYYYVTSATAGEYVIPAMTIRIAGQDYTTMPVTLSVYERDPSDPALDATRPYFANLITPSSEVYAGQMAPFDLDVYVRGGRSINDMGPPILRHESIVIDFDRTYQLDGVELDGIPFSTAQRPGSFFGLTPGSYTLGPAEVQVAMIDDSSPFGRMPGFFQSFVAKTLRSNPLTITVKPLPDAGKPSNFRGAVGRFSVMVKAAPLKLSVGDPISLDFEVTGPGNYETLQAPALLAEEEKNWRSYDARKIVDPAEVSDGVSSGKATFTQIVMPQAEVSAIPSFELAYFNPETGAYETQRTEPIPITVAPDPRPATAAAGGIAIPGTNSDPGGPANYAVDAAQTPEPAFNDIVHIRTTDPTWRPAPAAVTSQPLFWIGQIVPSLALFTFLGVGLARRVRKRKRQRSDSTIVPFKTAKAAVESATSRGEYYRNVIIALDSWSHEAGPTLQARMPDNVKAALEALRSRSQWILYGASDADQARAPESQETAEAGQILEVIGRHLH